MSQTIEISRDQLRLSYDPATNSVSVARTDGAVAFGPILCRARFRSAGEKAYDPVSTMAPGWQTEATEIATPFGPAPGVRATLDAAPGLPARLCWEMALLGGEEALFRLTLENRDTHAFKLTELVPVGYRGADPGLDLGVGYLGWRCFGLGYQSWSPSGSVGVMEADAAPRFCLPARSGMNPRTPYSRLPGQKAADWMAQIVDPQLKLSALLGFVTSADQNGRVELEVKYDRFRRLEAIADHEERRLPAGATVASEWALLSLSRNPHAQQERYLDLWGQAMKARRAAPLTGWCSWYFAFWKVSEKIATDNLAVMDDWKGLLTAFQIDDGYETAVGDWRSWNKKFVGRPKDFTGRVRGKGLTPGLWLAPFLVSRGSKLFREHPDWVVRNRHGRPVIAFIHPVWKGRIIYALDATHPGVQKWLRQTVRAIVHDQGFTYLKLDFLYAAALPGLRNDRAATGAAALRRGLEIIREEAGESAYLLGCGCPLGPAVGLVDAMRVSPDVDIRWRLPLLNRIAGVPTGPGAENCLTANATRLKLHGRLWANDPDGVVLRETRGGMTPAEIQSELTMYFLTAGAVFVSENLPALSAERRQWLRRMLPPAPRAAVAVDLFERRYPKIFLHRDGDEALAALFNWMDEPRELFLDLNRLGLSGPMHVFDGWAQKYLGAVTAEMSLGFVPAHGVRLLRLVPADARPRLLAIEHHLGLGNAFAAAAPEGDGLKVTIELPGPRRGKVWAVFPGGAVSSVEAAFNDRWEGLIRP